MGSHVIIFFGYLWAGEICGSGDNSYDGAHLNFNDVLVDSMEKPSSLRIRIKAYKTCYTPAHPIQHAFYGNSASLEDQPTSLKGFVWCP